MVAGLLTILTLSVMQLGLALHVRNTVLDAASEGARFAALADNGPAKGAGRTRDLIAAALGPEYAEFVTAGFADYLGERATVVTVRAPLPLLGLAGLDRGLEVSGHAAVEKVR